MSFGNAASIDIVRQEAIMLRPEAFGARFGDAFLVVHTLDVHGDATDTNTNIATDALLARSEAGGDALAVPPIVVYFVKKTTDSKFDWVAVGRHAGNDIVIPHKSVSRFHAFFRFMDGGVFLQDAKSQNGTFVGDRRVPRTGEGEPIRVSSPASLRFGDVATTFLDAAGLSALLTHPTAGVTRPSP